jgi:hypothetical protein
MHLYSVCVQCYTVSGVQCLCTVSVSVEPRFGVGEHCDVSKTNQCCGDVYWRMGTVAERAAAAGMHGCAGLGGLVLLVHSCCGCDYCDVSPHWLLECAVLCWIHALLITSRIRHVY